MKIPYHGKYRISFNFVSLRVRGKKYVRLCGDQNSEMKAMNDDYNNDKNDV